MHVFVRGYCVVQQALEEAHAEMKSRVTAAAAARAAAALAAQERQAQQAARAQRQTFATTSTAAFGSGTVAATGAEQAASISSPQPAAFGSRLEYVLARSIKYLGVAPPGVRWLLWRRDDLILMRPSHLLASTAR